MKRKRIVITGASTYGVKNHGDDAMLKIFCEGVKEKMPNAEVIFITRHPNDEFDKEFGIKSIKNIEHNSKKESLGRFFYGFNHNDRVEHLEKIKNEIQNSDLVVIGGNAFMEVSPSEFLRGVATYAGQFAILSKFLGKPYVIYGAAVYPIKYEYTKKVAKFLCENASLVTLREKDSLKELEKNGVENHGNIKAFADPAWGLKPAKNPKRGTEILKKEGISLKTSSLIGIVFRNMYWVWNDKESEKYANLVAQLCDNLATKLNSDVILFPNCTYNIDTPFEDDRVFQNLIHSKVENKAKIHILKNEYSLNDTLSIYPLLNFLISNRRHSLIFASVHNVPIFALSTGHPWHFKPWIRELGLTKQLASLTEDKIEDIEKSIINSFYQKEKIRKTISQNIPQLRKRAIDQVYEIIKII